MSGSGSMMTELATLEGRVRKVAELVATLREENRLLEAERDELRAKVRKERLVSGLRGSAGVERH